MPDPTRRSMLLFGLSAAGAGVAAAPLAGLGGGTALAAPASSASAPGTPAMPLRSDFTGAVGALFRASPDLGTGGGEHRLRLREIADVPPVTTPDDEHAFNLLFEQVSAGQPVQGIYRLLSASAPSVTLFLSPVDRPGGGHVVQALVNRRLGR